MTPVSRTQTPHSYSSAVAAGDFVFLGLHRAGGADINTQLEGTLAALQQTLGEYGLTLHDLVKVNVWLARIEDLPVMEQGFVAHFPPSGFPARMTATTEFVDDDCLVMIDGTAYRDRHEAR
jgi:2-iminobutanoate/2-iminopropanoate deaminase